MLVTQQPVFRKFWHAVMPLTELAHGPKPFTLLGEDIVLFIDADGQLLDCDHNRRCISADLASLRAIPRRMLVVQQEEKFEALTAALKGGFASHLIVTAALARRLLERWRAEGLTRPAA